MVVVPSVWKEPFGRVVIESYAYGKPVLAANRGGLPEIVKSDTGRIFDPESSTGFEVALTEIVSLYREGVFDPDMIKKYARQFSIFRHAKKYVRLYDSLL
jgi:glycosyltransferase involved in cell wall biosynthesis